MFRPFIVNLNPVGSSASAVDDSAVVSDAYCIGYQGQALDGAFAGNVHGELTGPRIGPLTERAA